jgi:nitrous oxidase accessory protein
MMHVGMTISGMAALSAAILALPAFAETIILRACEGDLQSFADRARPGDVLRLEAGEHQGPVTITRTITLEGEPGAAIVGNGEGSVISVNAPDSVVRGLEISGSGTDIETLDAGVFLAKTAAGAIVENNAISGNLYGIQIHGARDANARGNRIIGIREGRTNEAGNGVSVWNAPGAKVIRNEISFGRDGIFSTASRQNTFSGNRFENVRFAIHYMYTNDSEISDNRSVGNAVGYAIMYSNNLKISGNSSDGDRDHGLLLNYSKGSKITGNVVRGRLQPLERWTTAGQRGDRHGMPTERDGAAGDADSMRLAPEKCVFIYNANRNRFVGNWFENCAIGIHFTAGSEGNTMSENAFIRNRTQVKYVGTRYIDWSDAGRGNYWSDNPAFDLDGDGLGDNAYRPNDLVDRVLWTAPQAKLLVNSPAVQVLRWAQNQFPALLPGGVVDSHPLMAPPTPQGPAQ